MLIAGITLLIGILFGGSDLSTFLVEDLPKEIKHNVEDKEKQKQILAVLKRLPNIAKLLCIINQFN